MPVQMIVVKGSYAYRYLTARLTFLDNSCGTRQLTKNKILC